MKISTEKDILYQKRKFLISSAVCPLLFNLSGIAFCTDKIDSSDDYVVNGVPQSREALNRLLRRYARLMPDAEFLLQCDPESRHRMLVTLLADLAKNNLKNVKLLKS